MDLQNKFLDDDWSEVLGSDFIECSAKKNMNVTTIFKTSLEKYFSVKKSRVQARVSNLEESREGGKEPLKSQGSFELFDFLKLRIHRKRITSNLSSNGSQARKVSFYLKSPNLV